MSVNRKVKSVLRIAKYFRKYYKKYKKIDINLIKDIFTLPFLTRKDLFNFFYKNYYREKNNQPFFITMTSGTTENSFFILRSKKSFYTHLERQKKIYRTVGVTSKHRFLNLLSYSISGAARIIDMALRSIGACVIPVGSIKYKAHLDFVIKTIKELKPTVMEGYVNEVFDVFAVIGKKHSIEKCILTGEYLSEEFKMMIHKMGGVDVYNNYGSMEFSGFGISESPDGEYMRLFEDGLYIEVLKDDGETSEVGEGKIVITDLENTCMPFVRYILGDIVEIIKKGKKKYIKILGRTEDSILVDGEVFSKTEIIETIQSVLKHPKFFILIDKDKKRYTDKVFIMINPQDKNKEDKIERIFSRKFPFDYVKIRYYSGDVPKTLTGKFRHIIDLRKKQC